MNKKILTSLILAILVSLLITFFVAGFFSQREITFQKNQNKANGVAFGEILVPFGVPFPFECRGLCIQEMNVKNLLKDIAVFYLPSYILVYFLVAGITKRRVRFVSK